MTRTASASPNVPAAATIVVVQGYQAYAAVQLVGKVQDHAA